MTAIQRAASAVAGWMGHASPLVRILRPRYETLLLWTSGGKGVRWPINGQVFRVDPRYRHRLGQHYDAPVAGYIRKRLRPGAICMDVGANVGVYVLQFSRWAGRNGRVIAFEPNPAAATILRRHVAWNNSDAPVAIVEAAAGASAGSADLFVAAEDGMSRLGEPNALIARDAVPVRVPVVTVDDYCESERVVPDWLFIDVEGFELAVLRGARRTIERAGASLNIVVEMHPNVWESSNASRGEMTAFLEEIGRRVVALTGQADPLGEHGIVALEHEQAGL